MQGLLRFDKWLSTIPVWSYSLILTIAIVLKGGFSFFPLGPGELANYPLPPDSWGALSYGMRSVVFALGQDGELAYSIVGLLLVVLSVSLLTYFASREFQPLVARLFLALVIVGPIGLILVNRIGRNDVFMILGAVIFALCGYRLLGLAFGLLFMILANPEQAVVAMAILLLVSMIPQLHHWRNKAFWGLMILSLVFVPLWLLAKSTGVKSRIEYLPDFLSNSFYAFAANLPLSLYAAYGAVWLILGWVVLNSQNRVRIWLLIALVVIPVSVTMITVDQTRVYVSITAVTVVIVLRDYLPKLIDQLVNLRFKPILATGFLTVMFLPVIDIWGSSGHVQTPYLWIFTSIVPQIKDLILG
jgi:hypothetical protein